MKKALIFAFMMAIYKSEAESSTSESNPLGEAISALEQKKVAAIYIIPLAYQSSKDGATTQLIDKGSSVATITRPDDLEKFLVLLKKDCTSVRPDQWNGAIGKEHRLDLIVSAESPRLEFRFTKSQGKWYIFRKFTNTNNQEVSVILACGDAFSAFIKQNSILVDQAEANQK